MNREREKFNLKIRQKEQGEQGNVVDFLERECLKKSIWKKIFKVFY